MASVWLIYMVSGARSFVTAASWPARASSPRSTLGLGTFAHQQPSDFAQHEYRHAYQQNPNSHGGGPIEVKIIQIMSQKYAGQRSGQAYQGGQVFEQNGKYSRVSAVAQGPPETRIALGFAELPVGQRAGRTLKQHVQAEHPVVPGRVGERGSMLQVLVAFVERQVATYGKNHHRHNHRSEIQLLAVAEGMPGVGGPLAAI